MVLALPSPRDLTLNTNEARTMRFGDVFPGGFVVLGVEPVREFSGDAASVQPLPQVRVSGFLSPAAGFEGLTITAYAGRHGRVADSVRATGLRAPGVGRAGQAGNSGETAFVRVLASELDRLAELVEQAQARTTEGERDEP